MSNISNEDNLRSRPETSLQEGPGNVNEERLFTEREQRLLNEDTTLAQSPLHRKTVMLDYIRRARFEDRVDILPDFINLSPVLFESGLIPLNEEVFNIDEQMRKLIAIFHQAEALLVGNDLRWQGFFQSLGLRLKVPAYLDTTWYEKNVKFTVEKYLKTKNPKSPLSPEQYEKKQLTDFKGTIGGLFEGDLDVFAQKLREEALPALPEDTLPSQSIEKFIFENRPKEGFRKLPKQSEYKGEILEAPPSFLETPHRLHIKYIDRDEVPDVSGGVMLDGNFGYDEKGESVRPDNFVIIDHHDDFDRRSHDNATSMVFDFFKEPENVKKLEDPRLLAEDGEIRVLTNNIDADSIFSTWAFRNRQLFLGENGLLDRKKNQILRVILTNTTKCGDFLLGTEVLDYGATARDYEYLLRGYIHACRDQIKDGRKKKLEESLPALETDLEGKKKQSEEVKSRLDTFRSGIPGVLEKEKEMSQVSKGIGADGVKLPGKERGAAIQKVKQELDALLVPHADALSTLEEQKTLVQNELQQTESALASAKRSLKSNDQWRPDAEANELLLNHLHDVVLDMVEHPFKYQKFLEMSRDTERETIRQIDQGYRKGEIEITPDTRDNDLLFIRPLTAKKVPRVTSIDGLYFFFRGREDFNRELIVTSEPSNGEAAGNFMMAINTQHALTLKKYDFNLLIDDIRNREDKAIADLIAKKQAALPEAKGKDAKQLQTDIKSLEGDRERNRLGQLWRSRTQMIFAFKTYIPEAEILDFVYRWKHVDERQADTHESVRKMLEL